MRTRLKKQPTELGFLAKLVMPGLVPGIHVLLPLSQEGVDGRDKPGHDEKAIRGLGG
jgi:hypothetical protein